MSDITLGGSPTHEEAEGPLFSTLPPIYVLPTHFSLESLHQTEETLLKWGASLTYDISEARLILGKIGQQKRAALELRSRGIWTEETELPSTHKHPNKRRRLEQKGETSIQIEEVHLSTETEGEDEDRQAHRARAAVAQLKRRQISSPSESSRSTSEQQDTIKVVKMQWLDECIEAKELVPIEPFIVYYARRVERPTSTSPVTVTPGSDPRGIIERAKQDAALRAPSASPMKSGQRPPKTLRQTTLDEDETGPLPPTPDWVRNNVLYACMRSSPLHPPNERFIEQLIKIRTIRELNLDYIGVRAYSTAIASIAAVPYELSQASQVLALPGCDHKIANLFTTFKQSSNQTIPDAEALEKDPDLAILNTFSNIWGVGSKTARDFYYARHWHDIDDIVQHGWNQLSRIQQIGVKFYDEFLMPIPRPEVEGIARVVQRHANLIRPPDSSSTTPAGDSGIECIIVGSYRRGKETIHDVDLILTHRDDSVTENLVFDLVRSLETENWITHTLSLHLTTSARGQQTLPYRSSSKVVEDHTFNPAERHFDTLDKALVVWQDPNFHESQPGAAGEGGQGDGRRKGNPNPNPHRRVDIIVAPWRTIGCAVLGWTGDTTFERDLRRWAKKAHGLKFDSSGVRERTDGGRVIDMEKGGKTWEERERLVMEELGIGWREPWERCTR